VASWGPRGNGTQGPRGTGAEELRSSGAGKLGAWGAGGVRSDWAEWLRGWRLVGIMGRAAERRGNWAD